LKFFLITFQVRRALSHSFSIEAMAKGPPDMKCYKKTSYINLFIYLFLFFRNRRALSHSFGVEAMAKGPLDLKCYKKKIYLKK
jgi:hypothetical protein